MVKIKKPKINRSIPQNADLKCKGCGSTKFSVHVEVQPDGDVQTVELECAECAVTQVPLDPQTLEDPFLTTTLDDA